MIQISQIKLPPGFTEADIRRRLNACRIPEGTPWEFVSLSLDARRKKEIHYLASLRLSFANEERYLKGRAAKSAHAEWFQPSVYQVPEPGRAELPARPVIIGAGPAGLFAARLLAREGYAPVVIERGAPVEERAEDVRRFWETGVLNPASNVQFGEGGAGTFSDGKLATQVKDRCGRIRQVLTWFVEAGADPSILYWKKPHIGTDVLHRVIRNLRESILADGGEIHFHTRAERLIFTDSASPRLKEIEIRRPDGSTEILPAGPVVCAVGHSARDTFAMLRETGVPMQAKNFAVGVRVEHPQAMIQTAQYGEDAPEGLPVADYKLTARTASGRGVYSFCMCPGGQVVNASSEEGRIAVNGMSVSKRDGRNANSALVVTVTPADYGGEDVLAGVGFQRKLERLAWEAGEGRVPVQLFRDFLENVPSKDLGAVIPDICGDYSLANLRGVLPEAVSESLISAMPEFGRKIRGFDRGDAVFSGVESRTSSPVRILRDEHYESAFRGLFPCGEGAGYAGGITSAAVDGLKVAEELIRRYRRWT